MYIEEEDLYFTLNSKREELKLFNGAKCKIVNSRRDDNLLEVYVYGFNSFILVGADELDEWFVWHSVFRQDKRVNQ